VLFRSFMAGAIVLESGLKFFFQRARPEVFFGSLPSSYSFPSGHALLSLCFYAGLAVLLPADWGAPMRILIWLATALLVLGIGLSRIYLGVHHPTDVIGGYLAALFWTNLFWAFPQTRQPVSRR